jgi:hypothetical protein
VRECCIVPDLVLSSARTFSQQNNLLRVEEGRASAGVKAHLGVAQVFPSLVGTLFARLSRVKQFSTGRFFRTLFGVIG